MARKDTFLRDALKKTGLKPDADVSILQMGGIPQVGSALLAGKIDAESPASPDCS